MAIALRAAGTATLAAATATTLAPAVPAGTVAGDLSVLSVECKPYTTTITTPTGWTKIGEATNGTVANAADVGSTKIAMYVRENAPVGAIPAITMATAGTACAVIHSYSKDAADNWDYSVFTSGGDSTNAANYSATGSAIATTAADWIIAATAVNSDLGTVSAQAIGGLSGDTLSQSVRTAGVTGTGTGLVTTGNGSRLIVVDAAITAGSSSAAPTFTYTNASSTSGTTMWLRLREAASTSNTQGSETWPGSGAIPAQWTVVNAATTSQASGRGSLAPSASTAYRTGAIYMSGATARADWEVSTDIVPVAGNVEHYPGIAMAQTPATAGTSSSSPDRGYAAILEPSGNLIEILKSTTGTQTSVASFAYTFTSATKVSLVFRKQGNTLSVWAWDTVSGSRAGTPNWTATDTSFTTTALKPMLVNSNGAVVAVRTVTFGPVSAIDPTYSPADVTATVAVTAAGTVAAAATKMSFPAIEDADTLASDVPTITTAAQATTTISGGTLVAPSDARMHYRGAGGFAFGVGFPLTTVYAPSSNYPNTYASPVGASVTFQHTGTTFEVMFYLASASGAYRLKVDGKRVTNLPLPPTGLSAGGRHVRKFVFGSSATRTITLEYSYHYFGGVFVNTATDTIAAAPAFNARIIFQGDSITGGSAQTTGLLAGTYPWRVADYIGVDDPWNEGAGATGFVDVGTTTNLPGRISDVTSNAPDIVVVWAGYNDGDEAAGVVQAAAISYLDDLRAALPSAELYVVGCWVPLATPTAAMVRIDTELEAAALSVGLPFISPLTGDVNDAAGTLRGNIGEWVATSGDVTAYVGADNVHPNDAGQVRIAQMMRAALYLASEGGGSGRAGNVTATATITAAGSVSTTGAGVLDVTATLTAAGTVDGGGAAQIALVQQVTGSGATTTPVVAVPTTTAGNALVLVIVNGTGATNPVSAVNDNGGNTWTLGAAGFQSGSNTRIEIWYSLNTAPTTSVTVTKGSTAVCAIGITEWSGVALTGALDQAAGAGSATATSHTAGPVTTTSADELLIGGISFTGSATTTLNAAGFTSLTDLSNTQRGRVAYRVVSSAGTYSINWTLSVTAPAGNAMVALRAAAASDPDTSGPAELTTTATITADGASGASSGSDVIAAVLVTSGGATNSSRSSTVTTTAAITSAGVVGRSSGSSLTATAGVTPTGATGRASASTVSPTVTTTAAGSTGSLGSVLVSTLGTATPAGSASTNRVATVNATVSIAASGVVNLSRDAAAVFTATVTTAGVAATQPDALNLYQRTAEDPTNPRAWSNATRSTAQVHSGTYAWRLSVTGDSTATATDRILVQAGHTYRWTGWLFAQAAGERWSEPKINYYDAGGAYIGGEYALGVGVAQAWTAFDRQFTVPAGVTQIELQFGGNTGSGWVSGEALYWDDLTYGEAVAGTVSLPVTAAVTAAGIVGRSAGANLAATAAVSPAGSADLARSASVPVNAAVATTGSAGLARSASVTTAATISAAGTVATNSGASLNVSAAVASSGGANRTGTVALSIAAATLGAGVITSGIVGAGAIVAAAAITAAGTLAASGGTLVAVNGSVTAAGIVGVTSDAYSDTYTDEYGLALTTTAIIATTGSASRSSASVLTATAAITADGVVGTPGGVTVTTAAVIGAAGTTTVERSAAVAVAAAVTASGVVTAGLTAPSAVVVTSTVVTAGQVGANYGSVVATSATVAAAGSVQVSRGSTVTATAAIVTAGITGSTSGATRPIAVAITATGTLGQPGGVSVPVVALVTASGQMAASGTVTSGIAVTIAAAGVVQVSAPAAGQIITATIITAGIVGVSASTSIPATATVLASGQLTGIGSALSVAAAITTSGMVATRSGVIVTITMTTESFGVARGLAVFHGPVITVGSPSSGMQVGGPGNTGPTVGAPGATGPQVGSPSRSRTTVGTPHSTMTVGAPVDASRG